MVCEDRAPERGHTLVEMLFVLLIMAVLASLAIPWARAATAESHIRGAAEKFQASFLLARSRAASHGVYTAIRFESQGGTWSYSVYIDGDRDGVRADDINKGIDRRIEGPFPLHGGAPGVRVGINPGVPSPDGGPLDPGDPIKFGNSNMLSFSPLGTATPGTFYLAGDVVQAAVRVNGSSARVRLLIWRGKWVAA